MPEQTRGSRVETIYEALGREPVHPFPARMAPGIALEAMSELVGARILDPMMGSGTVLAMARAAGHRGIGFDMDPLAALISRVWTTSIDADALREEGPHVLERARADFQKIGVNDALPPDTDIETHEFIKYWFDGHARRQLAALSRSIQRVRGEAVRNALWCAFSRLIITKQSGASRAMDLSHSRPHRAFRSAPQKPFDKFLSSVERVAKNVINKRHKNIGYQPAINTGDARFLPLEGSSIDLVLTSPPYLNAIDYIRCSKFSLVWMGYRISELRRIRSESIGTEAAVQILQDDNELRSVIQNLQLAPALEGRHMRMLARYILDMRSSIREVARVLNRRGKAVYVIGENSLKGTYIKTSIIITKLAEFSGLRLEDRRTRTLPANRRYMPPPSQAVGGSIEARMRREVVLTFAADPLRT